MKDLLSQILGKLTQKELLVFIGFCGAVLFYMGLMMAFGMLWEYLFKKESEGVFCWTVINIFSIAIWVPTMHGISYLFAMWFNMPALYLILSS